MHGSPCGLCELLHLIAYPNIGQSCFFPSILTTDVPTILASCPVGPVYCVLRGLISGVPSSSLSSDRSAEMSDESSSQSAHMSSATLTVEGFCFVGFFVGFVLDGLWVVGLPRVLL